MDRFAPIAPARVKVLVLPIGPIQRSKFESIVEALRTHATIVPLKHVPARSDDLHLLTPLHYLSGSVIYDYTTTSPTEQHRQLTPFELFHESLLVIGVIDTQSYHVKEHGSIPYSWDGLKEALREHQPHAILRQLVVLGGHTSAEGGKGMICLPDDMAPYGPSLKTAIYALTATFLRELSSYAKALPPDIKTPGQTSRSLQASLLRRNGDGTPTGSHVSSPVGGNDGSRPSSRDRNASPPTSFDQITSANRPMPNMLNRSDSRASNRSGSGQRDSSRERKAPQGFGTLSASKMRERGVARHGIVVNSIRVMGGHWKPALDDLVIHTSKAYSLNDHIWHAKGLETMMICMLLMAWGDLTFSIPVMCFRESNRRSAQFIGSTSTVPDNAKLAAKQGLSKALPDLTEMILEGYCMGEGSLEVQPLVPAEASIRFSKLLAMRLNNDAVLDEKFLKELVAGSIQQTSGDTAVTGSPKANQNVGIDKSSRIPVASMIGAYCHSKMDSVDTADQIQLLAGIASVYSLLGMDRKKGMVIRDLVVKMTAALQQARKLGAAEQGVHPSTGLQSNPGQSLEDTGTTKAFIAELGQVYGIDMSSHSQQGDTPVTAAILALRSFGWQLLKFDILRDLIALSQAHPLYAEDVWRLVSTFLKHAREPSAASVNDSVVYTAISADEQLEMLSLAARAETMAKGSTQSGLGGEHWDPFFVRGIEFYARTSEDPLLDRSVIAPSNTVPMAQLTASNPLLYDPNSSRPGTAEKAPEKHILVYGEGAPCIVTLQNRLDISIYIESLQLVTEGLQVGVSHGPIKLAPSCTQQVYVSVTPCAPGEIKVVGCKIKVPGVDEAVFPIVSKPWNAKHPQTIKSLGLEGADESEMSASKQSPVQADTVSATVVHQQPRLELQGTDLTGNAIMLLEGERKTVRIFMHNSSALPARIFSVVRSSNVSTWAPRVEDCMIDVLPGTSLARDVEVLSFAGCVEQRIGFYYCALYAVGGATVQEGNHARLLTVSLQTTVNAVIQVRKLDVYPDPDEERRLKITVVLQNLWPQPIKFHLDPVEESIAPGEMRTVRASQTRWSTAGSSDEDLRTDLFERLKVTWFMEGRSGETDLRGVSLSQESLAAIRDYPLVLTLKHLPAGHPALPPRPSQFKATGDPFASVEVTITNRALGVPVIAGDPLLLQIDTTYGEGVVDAETEMPFAYDSMSRTIDTPVYGETRKEVFAILPRFSGRLTVTAQVRRYAPSEGARQPSEPFCAERRLILEQ